MTKKAIIAENHEVLRKSLVNFIEGCVEDATVETVTSGMELIHMLINDNHYGLILVDFNIGEGLTGIETIEEIRSFNKEIPTYLMGSIGGNSKIEEYQKKALEIEATGFINKNDLKELKKVVVQYLG